MFQLILMERNTRERDEGKWREMKWKKLTGNERNQYKYFGCDPLLNICSNYLVVSITGRVSHTTHFGNLHYLVIDKQQPQQVEPLYESLKLSPLYFPSWKFVVCHTLHLWAAEKKELLLSDRNLGKNGNRVRIFVPCYDFLPSLKHRISWFKDLIATCSQTLDKNDMGLK